MPEKVLPAVHEALNPKFVLGVCVEFTEPNTLHFDLCPDFQCASWHVGELGKRTKD